MPPFFVLAFLTWGFQNGPFYPPQKVMRVAMLNSIALLFFPLCMVLAAISDLTTMRISNKLVLLLTGGFLIVALLANLTMQEFAIHVATGLAVLIVAFTFFAMGWIGGGDAKLAAATAMWMGIPFVLPYIVYAGLMGGALTLALLSVRRFPLPMQLTSVPWIEKLHHPQTGIPYGIALAAAGLTTYSSSGIFAALLG